MPLVSLRQWLYEFVSCILAHTPVSERFPLIAGFSVVFLSPLFGAPSFSTLISKRGKKKQKSQKVDQYEICLLVDFLNWRMEVKTRRLT